MFYIAYLALGLAVFFMVRTIFSDEERRSAGQALGIERLSTKNDTDFFLKIARPFFARYVVPVVQGMKIDDLRKQLKRRLASGGLTETLTPDELFSFKLSLIIICPVLLIFVRYAWDMEVPAWAFPASMVFGYFYPDRIWLAGVIKRRQEDILRSMPFVVDLLALSTEAGLDFMGAIGKVVEKAKRGPFVQEMDTLLREIKVGASRAEAMRNMAWRIDMTEVNSFVAVLISADEMGASIGKILRQQSEQIRHERFMRAEKAGAKASQKVLFPMIFFIIPAIFIMIFGPFALQFMGGVQ
jgi:tight adherence protein C